MIASQCKTLSSALVITAVIVVFSLTATSRALAEPNSQGKGEAESGSSVEDAKPKVPVLEEHQFDMTARLSFLILIMALAAYLRLRIEWSKKKVSDGKRGRVIPVVVVEGIIALAGFMLVVRIFFPLLELPPLTWFDGTILVTFLAGVLGLAILYIVQLVADIKWIGNGGARVPPGFFLVEQIEDEGEKLRMISLRDVLSFERLDDQLTKAKLRGNIHITFRKPRLW